jgi:hypothetical protein
MIKYFLIAFTKEDTRAESMEQGHGVVLLASAKIILFSGVEIVKSFPQLMPLCKSQK